MTAYIKGISVISPLSGDQPAGDDPVVSPTGSSWLKCIEPSYRDFIDPMALRRMSRIVRMGVFCARKCMNDTGIELPDAIIAGTGLGCLEDTGKFLDSIYAGGEKLLNPTPFIQSTHNTIAGAIALAVKCHGYNATYTQRGFSFESALRDALIQLSENPSLNILTGGFDEVTGTSFELTSRLGLWKNHPVDRNRLYECHTRGSIAGEGAAFLMLGGENNGGDVSIDLLNTLYDPEADISGMILEVLKKNGIAMDKIDLVLLGYNGDSRTDHFYDKPVQGIFKEKPVTGYKHLCGEYDTSTSFAVWLAWQIIKNNKPSLPAMTDRKIPSTVRSVLIYNQIRGKYHSIYYLEKC